MSADEPPHLTAPEDFDDSAPGDDHLGMKRRLTEVEKAIVEIKATLPHLATKQDVQEAIVSIERWMVATVIGMMVGFGGLFMAMSNALKVVPTPPPAAGQPTVIVLPPIPLPAPSANRPP